MSIRVLITGAGGDAAQGVIRALRRADNRYVIASVCIHSHSPGLYMSDISGIAPPYADADHYINFLINFINEHKIDVLIPTVDGEMPLISERRFVIESNTKASVIIGASHDMNICADKLKTFEYLSSLTVSQPLTFTSEDKADIVSSLNHGQKIIAKPREGGGSKGIHIFNDAKELQHNDLNNEYIYQIYEPYNKEYTAVVMKDDREVAASALFERLLINGRTMWCKRVNIEMHLSMLHKVAEGLDIPYLNIQFGKVESDYHVFDINPRFSGSTSSFSRIFNGPDLLVQKFTSGSMPEFSCSNVYFESARYYEDFVFNEYHDAEN